MKQISYREVLPGLYQLVRAFHIQTGIKGRSVFLARAGDINVRLRSNGMLFLGAGYLWNGADFIPDTPLTMYFSPVHDAFFSMFQRGLLPLSEFNHVAELAKRMLIEAHKFMLPAGVAPRPGPFIKLIMAGITSDVARAIADPANYTPPRIRQAPDLQADPFDMPDDWEPGT